MSGRVTAGLFAVEAKERWTGSRALVLVGHDHCPTWHPDREQTDEPALLRDAGYGATRTSIRFHCRCGWSLLVEQTETRPCGWPNPKERA